MCWTDSMAGLQHGLQENKSPCGTACTPWLCFWGDLWGSTAAPHGCFFGTGAPSSQRPCNKSTMTCCSLDQRLPALTAISWQCGCQFHVRVTSSPCCVLTCIPIISCLFFLYVYDPYYYWVWILLSHRTPGLHYLFIIALILALKAIHNLGMGGKWRGWEWMLPWVPGSVSVENFKLCQAKQRRPGELQRPTKSKEALKLLGEDEVNLLKTLKWHFCFLPVYHTYPAGVLLPGVKKVFTNRRFHLAPQKGWRLLASWPCSESHMASAWVPRPHSIAQPSSLPKPHRATPECASELLDSFTPPLHLGKGCTFTKTTGHRFQVPLDAVLV